MIIKTNKECNDYFDNDYQYHYQKYINLSQRVSLKTCPHLQHGAKWALLSQAVTLQMKSIDVARWWSQGYIGRIATRYGIRHHFHG
ncbi:MAG: hypothetical protein ACON31_07095 [Candidatus Puniceispirillaceae bacterium]